jgi:oxygen-independent coproporphyrinogen-3 oxidase
MEHAGTLRAATQERIDRGLVLEYMMNALRLVDGTSVACFAERTGATERHIESPRATAIARGWLVDRRGWLQPTTEGLQVLNRLLELFC